MNAEIRDQPKSLKNVLDTYLKGDNPHFKVKRGILSKLLKAKHFHFLACGTSYNACKAVENAFIQLLGIQTHVHIASDFKHINYPISKKNVYFFLSQSGETYDTKEALEMCLKKGATTIAFTNRDYTVIPTKASLAFNVMAGPETSVASTKAYTCQYLTLVMFAAFLANKKGKNPKIIKELISDAKKLPELVEKTIKMDAEIEKLTQYILGEEKALILSLGSGFPTALEGSLKILEITYKHVKSVSTAELLHGPLALSDEKLRAIVVIPNESNLIDLAGVGVDLLITNKCCPFIIVSNSNKSHFEMKKTAGLIVLEDTHPIIQGIIDIIILQLTAYRACIRLGLNVDKPRGLAKSVTVGG